MWADWTTPKFRSNYSTGLATLSIEVDSLAITRMHLAVIYDMYKRNELVVGSRRGVGLSYARNAGMYEIQICGK